MPGTPHHVVVTFGDRATEDLFHGIRSARVRRFPSEILTAARRRLDQLAAAVRVEDMRIPPGNRLEALRGDLAGYYSVRVNDQWRVVFRWTESGPADVRLTDYH